ncbi:MAG TPA: hypothetical protein P5267_02000 [Patescibacteria group bacterium]|nr:hypothetical protein [Patescibacteria group bacterium]
MKKVYSLLLATILIVATGCRQPKLNVTDDGGGVTGTYGMTAEETKALGESADPLMKNKIIFMAAKKVFTEKIPLTTEELAFLEIVLAGERGRSRSIVAQILTASARLGGSITSGTSQGTSVSAESYPGFHWCNGHLYMDEDKNNVQKVSIPNARIIISEDGIEPGHPDYEQSMKKTIRNLIYQKGGAPIPTTTAPADTSKQKK